MLRPTVAAHLDYRPQALLLILSASHQQRDRQSNALGHIFFRTSCSQCVFAICTLLKSLLAEFALNEHQLLHRLLLSSLFCNIGLTGSGLVQHHPGIVLHWCSIEPLVQCNPGAALLSAAAHHLPGAVLL